MTGGGETRSDFGFDAVDEHATADGRAGGNWCFEPGDAHHRVSSGSTSVEHEVGKVVKLLSVSAPAGGRFAVGFADDGDDADFAFLKLFSHLDRDDVAAAGGNHE